MISMVVPWYNRKELKQALPRMLENLAEVKGDLTIVNFGGSIEQLEDQIHDFKDQVRVVTLSQLKRFNKAQAQNVGAKYTTAPYIFFCDCDILFQPGTIKDILEQVSSDSGLFATLKGVKETEQNARQAKNIVMFGYQLKLRIKDGTSVQIIDNEEDAADGTRQAPGLLIVRRQDFVKVNGYNGRLEGWGWEDQDMICRLTLSGKLKRLQIGVALHISHDDHARMQSYVGYRDRWQSRDMMFRTALTNYDNNDFLGTYSLDSKLPTHVSEPLCSIS